ncbi:Phosphate ABC transporter, periplasmic phosphate-binding protein PstS [uncultured Synechococcales cyanobacterium]|uniref:Phosphate-binding protein n=1 Tax=uncultured Synechococcales cyanobacterium TaxID=1936017 RepID=A0A6J4VGF5_9CYAN|nr:Phosphate ABC transporter, periplasmic phosphate-binding protein PstS [uncultured Synechococcales cyanobacterium]
MAFPTTNLQRTATTSAVTAAFVFGPFLTAIAQAVPLTGAGATFPEPLYQRYASEIKKVYPDLQINYQGIGSGGGIKQLTAGTVDFGASDTAMTNEEAAKVSRGVIYVPTAGGAVAVVYNLPGVNNLKLSRKTLPAIFSGQITRWNDSRIVADNPGVRLPAQPIRLATRADSSGTTFIFTNHLSAIDPYFKGRIGANKAPRWTRNSLKAKGNPGVAQIVKRTPGAVGYVESSFSKTNRLQTAQVQAKNGSYVAPTVQAANQALQAVQFDSDNRVDFTKLGDPANGYPITGLTWIMVYKQYADPAKADSVKRMVQWILTRGQALNSSLEYTQIPQSTANRVVQAVQSGVGVSTAATGSGR